MAALTVTQKYADPAVVSFWQTLAGQGLQRAEQLLVDRYLPAGGHWLDLGCGAGRAVLALAAQGQAVSGIDLSLPMLQAGRALSAELRLSGANLLSLPFAGDAFAAGLMFFGALQHIPGRPQRRAALAEVNRVVQPGGRLLIGLDNLAPALTCYGYWLRQKIEHCELQAAGAQGSKEARAHSRRGAGKKNQPNPTHPPHPPNSPHSPHPPNSSHSPNSPNSPTTDATLWQRRSSPLVWHTRGLLRSLRWRTWPGLVDRYRRAAATGAQPGDVQVAQFSQPATAGQIYYHIYQAGEFIADAAGAGWQLLGWHSGSELNEGRTYPSRIRGLDKQLFFAFEKAGG